MKNLNQKNKHITLYGLHTVRAALLNRNRQFLQIFATEKTSKLMPQKIIQNKNIKVEIKTTQQIELHLEKTQPNKNQLGNKPIHQGIIAIVKPLPQITLKNLIDKIKNKKTATIVILDQVSDPANIGAILRSTYVFGADALIITTKNAPDETASLAKSASGALDKIPLLREVNLKRCMELLKKEGFWCLGFKGDAKMQLKNYSPAPKCAIIMGSEGKGMRELTEKNCDILMSIKTVTTDETIDSLNVSTATAVALYAITNKANS